jgi:hypothetical protein
VFIDEGGCNSCESRVDFNADGDNYDAGHEKLTIGLIVVKYPERHNCSRTNDAVYCN